MLSNNFSKNLCELRKKSGLSQEVFAEKLNVSRQAVSKWERNEAYPDIENLMAISQMFDISLDTLLGGDVTAPAEPQTAEEIQSEPQTFSKDKEDEEDDEDEKDDDAHSGIWFSLTPILVTIAFLLLGFLTDRGWAIGWTLYLLIPVIPSIPKAICGKKPSDFCYPVLVTFVYLFLGMHNGLWHPTWILFLTIPIYYLIVEKLEKRNSASDT